MMRESREQEMVRESREQVGSGKPRGQREARGQPAGAGQLAIGSQRRGCHSYGWWMWLRGCVWLDAGCWVAGWRWRQRRERRAERKKRQ
jgi:hypothetical protein